MPTYRVNAASISWISKPSLEAYSGMPNILADDAWLQQIAFGMSHTANPDPPPTFDGSGYKPEVTLARQYRALATYTVGLRIGAGGAFEAVTSLPVVMKPDPGYTPPFDSPWIMRAGALAQEFITISPGISAEIMAEAGRFSPGESSSLSAIAQPPPNAWQTTATSRLPYGSITPGGGETILAHSLVKFRAGAVGDKLGIVVFGAGNHVPWVWCETMLTYTTGSLVLYCAGSIFPSHAFYLGGARLERCMQHVSQTDLTRVFTAGLKADVAIDTPPPMATGMDMPPRPMLRSVNAQSPKDEPATTTPLDKQPYCAPAQPIKRRTVPVTGMPILST
jgi:hypothetical protein